MSSFAFERRWRKSDRAVSLRLCDHTIRRRPSTRQRTDGARVDRSHRPPHRAAVYGALPFRSGLMRNVLLLLSYAGLMVASVACRPRLTPLVGESRPASSLPVSKSSPVIRRSFSIGVSTIATCRAWRGSRPCRVSRQRAFGLLFLRRHGQRSSDSDRRLASYARARHGATIHSTADLALGGPRQSGVAKPSRHSHSCGWRDASSGYWSPVPFVLRLSMTPWCALNASTAAG